MAAVLQLLSRTLPSEKARDDDSVGTAGHGVLTSYDHLRKMIHQGNLDTATGCKIAEKRFGRACSSIQSTESDWRALQMELEALPDMAVSINNTISDIANLQRKFESLELALDRMKQHKFQTMLFDLELKCQRDTDSFDGARRHDVHQRLASEEQRRQMIEQLRTSERQHLLELEFEQAMDDYKRRTPFPPAPSHTPATDTSPFSLSFASFFATKSTFESKGKAALSSQDPALSAVTGASVDDSPRHAAVPIEAPAFGDDFFFTGATAAMQARSEAVKQQHSKTKAKEKAKRKERKERGKHSKRAGRKADSQDSARDGSADVYVSDFFREDAVSMLKPLGDMQDLEDFLSDVSTTAKPNP